MLFINLLSGLGIFLFGMLQLESSIQSLGSTWISRWLSRTTNTPAGSVLSGTLITALLQSSSMVSLLVLAFASAGMIPLYNSIGVLLGANLGTTFTGWVVATIGFKLNLSAAAIPTFGTGCLLHVFVERSHRLRMIGNLLIGFGLLLFGLDVMKNAVEHLPDHINRDILHHLSPLGFLLFGCALSAIIQSSSASMMLALAALHSGVVTLPDAAAVIIGADLGTTSTTLLGSIKGSNIKRQLAMAHVIFNAVSDALAFLFILPALPVIMRVISINDPLYSLVAFHSLFNFLGLVLFTPFLKQYTQWLSTLFKDTRRSTVMLNEIAATTPEAALTACKQYVFDLLMGGIALNVTTLKINRDQLEITTNLKGILAGYSNQESFEERYEQLKEAEGNLFQYVKRIQQGPLTEPQSDTLLHLLDCARCIVYAVKTIKDIRNDLIDLRHNRTSTMIQLRQIYSDDLKHFYQETINFLEESHEPAYTQEQFEGLAILNQTMQEKLNTALNYNGSAFTPQQLSTLMNVNRELHHSGNNIIQAVKHWSSG